MNTAIGRFRLKDSVSIVVQSNEIITMSPFGGLIQLEVSLQEESGDGGRWQLSSTPPNILRLTLVNHHTAALGGTSSENIILGSVPGKNLALRYSFHVYGEGATRSWTFNFNFGEIDV